MRSLKFLTVAALVLGVCGLSGAFTAAQVKDKAEAKYTIKEVMKEAHKSGLLDKVASGKAGKEDIAKLVEYYKALGSNKPGKGDPKGWKEKTDTLLAAAKEVADGKEGAGAKLKKAAACKACHDIYK